MLTENERWEELYVQTALEVDVQKMQERIAATRRAIAGRLRDLEYDSNHHDERRTIKHALDVLSQLEIETQAWPLQRFSPVLASMTYRC
jgi:hypothetical protein